MNKKLLVLGGVSLVSMAAGGVGGYFFAKKQLTDRLTEQFEEMLQEEINEAKQHYMVFKKGEEYQSPADAVRNLIPKPLQNPDVLPDEVPTETLERVAAGLKKVSYDKMFVRGDNPGIPNVRGAIFEPPAEPEASSIFDEVKAELGDPEDEGPIDTGHNDVSNTKPFVISKEEFFHNEPINDQVQWVYWAGDQVLMDESRNPVTDVNQAVGVRNLNEFGSGSGDKRIVYVRNQARGLDYEILYHEGKYAEEVAGFVPTETVFERGLHFPDDDE